jgi:hypothetical protein
MAAYRKKRDELTRQVAFGRMTLADARNQLLTFAEDLINDAKGDDDRTISVRCPDCAHTERLLGSPRSWFCLCSPRTKRLVASTRIER